MPDIGWQELFLIALVTILVVGPKEIPRVLRTVSQWVKKIKGMAREFQTGIDDLVVEADLDDFRKDMEAAKDFDVKRNIEDMVDPTGEYAKSIHDIEDSVETSLQKELGDDFSAFNDDPVTPADDAPDSPENAPDSPEKSNDDAPAKAPDT